MERPFAASGDMMSPGFDIALKIMPNAETALNGKVRKRSDVLDELFPR